MSGPVPGIAAGGVRGLFREKEIRTALLVDGSATMLYYYGILLKRFEYVVLTIKTAEDSLKVMEHMAPSLVLTEISLPGMSGIDLIRRMKSSDHARDIPVIVLTGEDDHGIRETCLGLGCAGYLIKPVDPDLLYRTLQAVSEPVPRGNIRLATRLKVVVGDGSLVGGTERIEYAVAVSEGGLYVRTLYPQPKNVVIPVRILIKGREISAKALVLYSSVLEEGPFKEPGMGMKFVEISAEDREFVRGFIKEQLTQDIGNGLQGAGGRDPD